MDNHLISQLWSFLFWFVGISATFTLTIIGWLLVLTAKVGIKIDFSKKLEEISKSVNEIKTALLGDFDKKGLVSKHYALEDRVSDLEKK